MTDIGKRIKELRNERDLTISDFFCLRHFKGLVVFVI